MNKKTVKENRDALRSKEERKDLLTSTLIIFVLVIVSIAVFLLRMEFYRWYFGL